MEIHYKRHLRKMNLLDQENLNTTKKNYGKKNIEIAFEKRIQEAIDNLKDLNSNINDENKNNEKKITHTNMKNNNNINNNKLFLNNVHNKEFISNEKFNTKNPNLIVPTFINSDTDFFRKLSGNELDKNLFKLNKEQNIINNFKENQHFISFPSLILPQDLQHLDQYNPENKNEPKIEDYGGMTRPESNVTLCNEQRPAEDAFLKEEDLESIDEGKNIQQNFFVNENYIINMPINYNYIFMDNQPNLMNGNKMLSFNFD
jgi:hypothetical protein